jgi:hypothetical protein
MHIKTSDQPVLELGFGDYICNWGVHMAGLYETEQEKDEIVLGFLNQGDLAGDLQLYCPVEQNAEDFLQAYEQQYPTCQGHTADTNCFHILSTKDLYYPDGIFSPWAMDEGLENFFAESQKNGKRNIRATAEMSWALDTVVPGIEHVMAYEARLNYFIPEKPWISICLYDVTRFSGAMIMNVLRTHPYTINRGVITENPYYQDPAVWLARNAPEFLARSQPTV